MVKKIAIRVLLVVGALGVTLFVLEGMVRVLDAHTTTISVPLLNPPLFLQPDEELGYVPSAHFGPFPFRVEHVDYELSSNEFGCFDKPYADEDPYILLMGDSFTHHKASLEEKWGSVLEKELGTRVLQCGVTGYSTSQELGFAKRIVSQTEKSPQLIIVGYFLNDFADEMSRFSVAESNGDEEPETLPAKEEDMLPVLKGNNLFVQTTQWIFI